MQLKTSKWIVFSMVNLKGFGCNMLVKIVYLKYSKETIWTDEWLGRMHG